MKLSKRDRETFVQAEQAYQSKVAAAWQRFCEAMQIARKEYLQQVGLLEAQKP